MEESIDSRGNSLENGVSLETMKIQILRTMSLAMEEWSLGESRNWSWNEKETIMVILFSAIFWQYPLIMMTGVMETTSSPRWPPTLHLWLHLRPKQPPQRLSFSLWPLKEEDRWEPWRAVRELTCRLDHYQYFQFRLVHGSSDHLYSIFQSALILLFD